MKKFKVNWVERDVVEYYYKAEVEIEESEVINGDILIIAAKSEDVYRDSIEQEYFNVSDFEDKDTGLLNIPDCEIVSYEEVLPPPPPSDDEILNSLRLELLEMEKKEKDLIKRKKEIEEELKGILTN